MSKKLLIAPLAFLIFMACGSEQERESNGTVTTAPPKMSEGKKLFVNNCLVCHSIDKDKTGPALKGVMGRWNNDTARVFAFIRNSAKMIAEGDERALAVHEEWNRTAMTPFPNLTDNQIKAILKYIETGE